MWTEITDQGAGCRKWKKSNGTVRQTKARFPWSVFWSGFGADFVCASSAQSTRCMLLKKNASTMNIAHVSMAQIAAPINVRADKVCYPTR